MPGKPDSHAPRIDIAVASKRWQAQPRAASVVRKAITEAARRIKARDAELSVLLTHDQAIRRLNQRWRGFDKPTNVLSFPAAAPSARQVGPRLLGDIVIAYQTLAREAAAERKPFKHHLSHLAVHGFLHLVGYDHETDADAKAMERLEVRILAGLTIPDPYAGEEDHRAGHA